MGDLAWLGMKPPSLLNLVAAKALYYIFDTFNKHIPRNLLFAKNLGFRMHSCYIDKCYEAENLLLSVDWS
jgi:hypothetical protein